VRTLCPHSSLIHFGLTLASIVQDGVVDAQDVVLAIDAAEKIYQIAKKESHKYSPQLRAVIGFGTLFYSRSFPYTIMFVRAFQVITLAPCPVTTNRSFKTVSSCNSFCCRYSRASAKWRVHDDQSTGTPLVKEAFAKLGVQYVAARQQFMAKRLPMEEAQEIVAGHSKKIAALRRVRYGQARCYALCIWIRS